MAEANCKMIYNIDMDMNGIGGLVAFILGWFFAQFGKMLGDLLAVKRPLRKKEIVNAFVRSGGMPSGHTASFLGLTTFLGMKYGFGSGLFVLALCTTIIVIYDAVNVRYAVGEQGKVINLMAENSAANAHKVKIVEGHTVPQVVVGAVIGICVGLIMNIIWQ